LRSGVIFFRVMRPSGEGAGFAAGSGASSGFGTTLNSVMLVGFVGGLFLGFGGGSGRWSWRSGFWGFDRGGGSGSFGDLTDDVADDDIVAGLFGDAQRASGLGGDFSGHFVGFEREEDVADFDEVAVFEVPFGDLASGDGFAECGDFDVSHCRGGV